MELEDRLPALLRGAADAQPDAPGLFGAVTSRVQRRHRRRRGLAAGGVAAVVAAAVAVPVAVSSQRTTDQRVVTVPVAPTRPSAPPPGAGCPATTDDGVSQPDAPDTQLFPDGGTALTVCTWAPAGRATSGGYRLTAAHRVPAQDVTAELSALNTLTEAGTFTLCLRQYPLLLTLIARYPDGRAFTVQLVRPCSTYLTNGPVRADAPPSVIAALAANSPVPAVPSGVLTVHLLGWPWSLPLDAQDVTLMAGRAVEGSLPRRRDGAFRARVRAGSYIMVAYVGTSGTSRPLTRCTGHVTVAVGSDASVDLACPVGRDG